MIRILQRYILFELIKIFILAAATLSGIFFLVYSVVYWQKFGLSVAQLVVTLPFIFPTILNYSLPMATLVTCTFAYGRLSADNEILAIQSSGIHLFPIAVPALMLGLALCPLVLHLSFDFIPRNAQKADANVRQNPDAIVKLLQTAKKVKIENREEGSVYLIRIGRAMSNRFLDVVVIQDFTAPGDEDKPTRELHAAEGYITPSTEDPKAFTLKLYDVSVILRNDSPGGGVTDVGSAQSETREISLKGYRQRPRPSLMTQDQLWEEMLVSAATESPGLRLKVLTEIHERWALSFTCFVFAMLGVPLGIFSRKGNFLAAFATGCLPVFLMYYPMQIIGKSMAQSGALPVALAMWSPDVFLLALGALLLGILFRR